MNLFYLNSSFLSYNAFNKNKIVNSKFILDKHSNRKSLRDNLSKLLFSNNKIFFRHNATHCLKDIILCLNENFPNNKFYLFSFEHPVIKQIIKLYSVDNIEIYKHGNSILNAIKKEVNSFSENCIPVIILSHVIWHSGEILEVKTLSYILKEKIPNIIIIIDGAQAVGNISLEELSLKDNAYIDFYLGCGQKWLNNHFPVGFFWMNSEISDKLSDQSLNKLYINDIYSQYAGKLNKLHCFFQDTYFKLGADVFNSNVLKISVKQQIIRNNDFNKCFHKIFQTTKYHELKKHNENSGIFSVYGTKNDIDMLYKRLAEKRIICSRFSNLGMDIIRFSTPVGSLKKVKKRIKKILSYD